VKILVLIIAATFLCFSALRAQEPDGASAPPKAAAADPFTDPFADLASSSDPSMGASDPMDTAVGSEPPAELGPPTTPDEAESLDQSLYGQEQAMDDASAEPDAQGRPWKVTVHAGASSYYDNNIFISPTGRQSDFVTLLSAGGGLILGDYTTQQGNYLISDYTAIAELFEKHSDQDAFEQNASVAAQVVLAHLTFKGNFQFEDTADADVDTGSRAKRQILTGNGSARYDISDKTFIEATAQFTISHYDLFLNSNDERGGLSFNFLPDPAVTMGLGVMAGVLNVEDSSAQTYEQFLASLQIAATGKFTLISSAGIEDRQTQQNKGLITPVFEIDGDYKPSEVLDLTFSAYRHVSNSAYYLGADFIATGVSAGAKYDFSDRFTVLLETGFMNCDYRDVGNDANVSRTDNYFFVRPALRYTASKHCNVELYYFYRKNASTLHNLSFNDSQVGISLNFKF
jgi:hypothetical protein